MALNLIIGDTSCGKSNMLCKRMVDRSVESPSSRFIAITPEQATLMMQKRVIDLHPKNVVTNIDIVSFNFLAHLVFDELAKEPFDILDDTGKTLVLKKVLEDIKDDLVVYKSKVRMPGFTDEAKSMITELKQYDIYDNDLFLMQEAAQEQGNRLLFSKISDIRLIYKKFNEYIEDRYTTAEEILDILARLVPDSKIISGAEIYMDGFTGFTPIQYKLIEKFLKYAKDVTVAFTLPQDKIDDNCEEHEFFYLSNQTYKKLTEMAEKNDIEIKVYACKRNEEKNPNIFLYAAETVDNEVEFAAKKILGLIKENDYRFRDIAIVTGDMETYHRNISKIFDKAGISYFIDHKNRLLDNMMSHFVLAASKIVEERFSYDSVFAYLKTGLVGIDEDDISKFENYCLEFGIKGFKAFKDDFYKNNKRNSWDLEKINDVRKRFIDSIKPFYEKISKGKSRAADYYCAYLGLFEKNDIEQKLKDAANRFEKQGQLSLNKEYEQIYEQTIGLFERINLILGDENLSVKEYREMIAEGLDEIQVGIIPPSLDAIIVGDITRTRISDVKTLFFLGVNEGNIPKASGGSLIFSQREREFLKDKNFEIAPTILENIFVQRFYIYLMLKKPSENLYISYPEISSSGTALAPSYVISDIDDFLPGSSVIHINDDSLQTWESNEIARLAKTMGSPDPGLLNYFAKEKSEVVRQLIAAAYFTLRENPLDKEIAEKIYGDILRGSVSRYEAFASCPYKHFLQYGLKLSQRAEYEVEAKSIGTIYHESLDKYSKALLEEGYTFRNVPDDVSDQIVIKSVNEAADEADYDVLESTARNGFLMQRICDISKKTVDVLRQHVKDGKYEPEFFEMKFESDVDDKVKFTGKIDRIDIYDGEDVFVKVIDYKSGAKKFDIKDIYSGKQLQLVAYMNEATKKIKKENPNRNVHPGGVYYYIINDKFCTPSDAAKKYKMSGLTNCNIEAMSALDANLCSNESNGSYVANIKYKNGNPSGDIANDDEFENMMDYVSDMIKDISTSIKDGKIEINPLYKDEKDNACIYCDYKDVCKFDESFDGGDKNSEAANVSKAFAEEKVLRRIKTDKKTEEND